MRKLDEPSIFHELPPGRQAVVDAEAIAEPALFVLTARVDTGEHTARSERLADVVENLREIFERNVK